MNKLIKKFTVLLAAMAAFALPLTGCKPDEPNDEPPPTGSEQPSEPAPVEGGTVSVVSRICMDITDESLKLPYTLEGGDGPVTFRSDYSSVAVVDDEGYLYPVAKGVANITASTSTSSTVFEVEVTDNKYGSYTKIRSVEDFEKLVENKGYTKSTGKYCLTCDIDFGGKTISPLGSWSDGKNTFKATFDGRGYALKNFVIDSPDACKDEESGEYFGVCLFPCINGGTVKNLNLIGVDFTGFGFTGGVCGKLESGTVENCFVQGRINATQGFASSVPSGGICGIMGATAKVKNCFIDLDIAGGFVFCGFNFGTGSNCYARKSALVTAENIDELLFQTDDTGSGNPDEIANLKEFDEDNCALLEDTQITNLRNFDFTSTANWATLNGYMAFIARPDGIAPEWAKIDLT